MRLEFRKKSEEKRQKYEMRERDSGLGKRGRDPHTLDIASLGGLLPHMASFLLCTHLITPKEITWHFIFNI